MTRSISDRGDTLPILGEVFREYGFSGASLSVISKATGLGKGSLYNFFPGGKEEMLTAVLFEIETWFEKEVFSVLRSDLDSAERIENMLRAVEDYFDTGRRVCLIGALALNDPDDRFSSSVKEYFEDWIRDLAKAVKHLGIENSRAVAIDIVLSIQGAIILTRALDDPRIFKSSIKSIRQRILR